MIRLSFLLILVLGPLVRSYAQNSVEVRPVNELNTEMLDFSPVPFRNGILFTSSRTNRFLQCPSDDPGAVTDLYFAQLLPDGTFGPKQLLEGEVNGEYNDGVAAAFPGSDRILFSRNNMDGKNAMDTVDLQLYSARSVEGRWTAIEPLPFNNPNWSTTHPALSADGYLLVFASNRPGSVAGSMDLWFARFEDGKWSEPFHAGPSVNTAGQELFPAFDAAGNLFFSSNGHGGAGGLDLFVAQPSEDGTWEMLGNMGAPFSGAGDDVSFSSLEQGREGYFSAQRADGKGLDDIYRWTYNPVDQETVIMVVDKQTGAPLPGATVRVEAASQVHMLDRLYEAPMQPGGRLLTADATGKIMVSLRADYAYTLTGNKEGYLEEKREEPYATLTGSEYYELPLQKEQYLAELTVLVVDRTSGAPLPMAQVTLEGATPDLRGPRATDGEGTLTLTVDCDKVYRFRAAKDGWLADLVDWKGPSEEGCRNGKATLVIQLAPVVNVPLSPVFFHFDKSSIRKPDAFDNLEEMAALLQRYPSLTLRLDAHCDARGSEGYNDRLAKRRAEAVRQFLVNRGVSESRLEVVSSGEANPINDCKDNIPCSESAHQLNRRVDLIPLGHEETGIRFRYQAPQADGSRR
ncbi:MAG: hypothetical protein RLY31_1074 [Bacteroidota bacterium]|jgi:outer membrane protein OmpA-like peptidoglycan-associated protein